MARFLTVLISLALAVCASAQVTAPHVVGTEPSRFDQAIEIARELVATLQQETGLPAISVAVNVEGNTVWEEGFGLANIELRAPARPETRYRLASISKAVTGVAVATLADEGVIDLDAPIETMLTDCPGHWHGITVRQLMGHTAGIRSYKPSERDDLDPQQRDTVDQALAMIRDDPLVHPPGERFTYTTLGYIVVRAIIEEQTGKDFMPVISERVFQPAGMHSTSADRNAGIIPNRAALYHTSDDGKLINAPHTNISYKPAGGGMVGTAGDLARLGHAVAALDILSSQARDELWKPTVSNSGETYDYGLGWAVATDTRGVFFAAQKGGQIGAGSVLVVFPDADVSVALFSNRAAGPVARSEAVPIARLFIDAHHGNAPDPPAPLPQGFFDLTITDQHGRTYAGRLSLATRRGRPAGELLVQALDNNELRRFRIATARAEADNTIRLYTVHQDWGVFPFVLTFNDDGTVTGKLDRQVEQWRVEGSRAEVTP